MQAWCLGPVHQANAGVHIPPKRERGRVSMLFRSLSSILPIGLVGKLHFVHWCLNLIPCTLNISLFNTFCLFFFFLNFEFYGTFL